MIRRACYCLTLMGLLTAGLAPGRAQEAPYSGTVKREFRSTCEGDMQAFCQGGDDAAIRPQVACLKKYHVDLSLPCRRLIARMSGGRDQAN